MPNKKIKKEIINKYFSPNIWKLVKKQHHAHYNTLPACILFWTSPKEPDRYLGLHIAYFKHTNELNP